MYRIIPLGLFTAVYSYLGKHTAMEKIKLQTTQNMDEFHRHHSELKKPDTKRKKKKALYDSIYMDLKNKKN